MMNYNIALLLILIAVYSHLQFIFLAAYFFYLQLIPTCCLFLRAIA